ncbi:F-box/kelch-repeat protein At3g23880-like [Telopea speciosissima]|uniref:F-box/kelch-repeat protein At3g23880-like n=1 Tax=Telopea speciosissima TaxID=54955 RepID=UPI001CC666B9|nr:F-box/kelch-repeat protein At3g23880-like [Telopea speciosissima]
MKRISGWTELSNLPDEVKDLILLSLPVKTVLRFRCVIRDYLRFHNPNFIKMHLNRQIEIHDDASTTIVIATAYKVYKADLGTLGNPIRIDLPFLNPTSSCPIRLLGSCNGLLCLTHWARDRYIVYLWNPATGEYKQLPGHNNHKKHYIVLGFGYDHTSGKFKVLAFSYDAVKNTKEVFVYTLGTSSWRSIGEFQFPRELTWQTWQVFEGCPHWIMTGLKSIVIFSVGNENFKDIPMPPIDIATTRSHLTALGGRLSIYCYVSNLKRHELWVRVNDGLEHTWTKHLSFNDSVIPGYLNGYIDKTVVWGFKNGQLLLGHKGPSLFDPVTGDVKALYLPGHPKYFKVYSYIESLAMLNVEDRVDVHQNSLNGVKTYREQTICGIHGTTARTTRDGRRNRTVADNIKPDPLLVIKNANR